jgi:glycogen operon protein
MGRTQQGNNNAYCHDDELSWFDWDHRDHDLLGFARTVLALRREHPALRPQAYLRGPEGDVTQMILYRPDGAPMEEQDWHDPVNALAVFLDGDRIEDETGDSSGGHFLLLVNAHVEPVVFTAPTHGDWRVLLTSTELDQTPQITEAGSVTLLDRSLLLLHDDRPTAHPIEG